MRQLLSGLLLVAGLTTGLTTSLKGAVDGQWTMRFPGSEIEGVLELKSDGSRLTGSLSGPTGKLEIMNGSFSADTIRFDIVSERRGGPITLSCTGRVRDDSIELTVGSQQLSGEERWTASRRAPGTPLPDYFSESAAPDEVLGWVKANAIRLASLQPGSLLSDMAPLEARLEDARIVAMGEATHGTREFQQFKARMLQFLVEKLGFTIFGIEANWPESLRINDYVVNGNGDPADILDGQFLWWQTVDVRDMIRWMRQYNQNPSHTRKVKFYGFDMQGPGLAESNVLDYLERVDRGYRETATQVFSVLGKRAENPDYEKAPADLKRSTAAALAGILRRFDDKKQEYIRQSSQQEWTMARQNMVIVKQAEVKLGNQNEVGFAFRNQAMAENVKWILDQEPAGSKMMLWAHNGHVSGGGEGEADLPMGGHLRKVFGNEVVLCGFVFEQGGFCALDMKTRVVRDFTVGPPPQGSLDVTMARIGLPFFVLDLRHLPEGKVASWFEAPHVSRQVGGGYSEATPNVFFHRIRPARAFDLLIFVERTTPIRLR